MAGKVLTSEEFHDAVRERYATPPTPISCGELEQLPADTTFRKAVIVAEYIEQLVLIIKELGERPDGNADSDLVAQGQYNCQRLHVVAQELALEVPHVYLDESSKQAEDAGTLPDEILSQEEFQAAMRQRYEPAPRPVRRGELEHSLTNTTFREAGIVAEYAEQVRLVLEILVHQGLVWV